MYGSGKKFNMSVGDRMFRTCDSGNRRKGITVNASTVLDNDLKLCELITRHSQKGMQPHWPLRSCLELQEATLPPQGRARIWACFWWLNRS
jgi:hypothetical protein